MLLCWYQGLMVPFHPRATTDKLEAVTRAAPFRAQLAEYARIKPPTTPIRCGSLAHGPSADRLNAAAAAVRAI